MNKFLLTTCLLATVLTSCSSDYEEENSTNQKVQEYTPAEIQKIKQMQEDYEVKFDIPKQSNKPLPTMEEMEELCKIIAGMNTSKKDTKREGNSIVCSRNNRSVRRSFSDAQEYSGGYSGSGSLEYNKPGSPYGSYDFGTFDYIIQWSKTNSSGCGSVSGDVTHIRTENSYFWSIDYTGFSYYYDGAFHIHYCFHFEARNRLSDFIL